MQQALATFTAGLADSPTSSTEGAFAEVLADVTQVERVSVDSNFFDDLRAVA